MRGWPIGAPRGRGPGRYRKVALLALALAVALAGCAGVPSGAARRQAAEALAASGRLRPLILDTGPACRPPLAAYARNGPGQTLTVYIEGDGQAYSDRFTPANDPTPADPLALRLAGLDPGQKVAYLARPGQYLPPEALAGCDLALWTTARYGPQALACLDAALDAAKTALGATSLRLVGYSGGGALAVLLAAGRPDVTGLATVAANLDTEAWTALHHVPPLAASRNPAEAAAAVAHIPQAHYAGSNDRNTPPWLCERFLARLPAGADARCLVIEGAGHHDGLAAAWPALVPGLPPSTPPDRP
ncbi:MAG: alpha/beta fold hydrolase [Solidesulfovibrio sp. DCME]|uniref:alpha/beta fold hydrolase n=1 Tax=Solidesulfovibrio sp. DCME TaxID=3447380 RepID=UPI003D0CA499